MASPDPTQSSPPDLEQAILDLLEQRAPGRTICPSDVARAVGPADCWRELMDPVRDAAWRLVDGGRVEVTQGGKAVSRDGLRGPIRIARVRPVREPG